MPRQDLQGRVLNNKFWRHLGSGGGMITISVCMIVKNEERVLARCLDSLRGIADEIIIVDTGSTDCTKQVARAYTDKIYDFEWVNDFSAARNFSFSKASMEYIYAADADEVIEQGERGKFLRLKQELDPSVEIVQMIYTNQLQFNTTYNFDEELRPKLYRRLREFTWQEPLHEMVRLDPVVLDTDIRIKHMPLEGHAGRDFAAFCKALERDGDLSGRLAGMYARELMIAGGVEDFRRCIPFFLDKSEKTADLELLEQCQCVLCRAGRLTGDTGLFFKNALKNMAMDKPASEVCWELGEYYLQKEDIHEAILWYYNAVYETEPILDLTTGGSKPAGRLAECHERLGCMEEAAQYREKEAEFLKASR